MALLNTLCIVAIIILIIGTFCWDIKHPGGAITVRPRKIYIICSVRQRSGDEEKQVLDYVAKLEKEGCEVRCPFRDTNQNDEIGLRIVDEHEGDIIWANEIHIIFNPNSQGSLWDFGQARMACHFMPEKKIVLVNVDEIEITRNPETREVKKSYTNVLLATHFGLPVTSQGKDLEKAKNKGA